MNRIICTICFYFISSTCIISAQGKTSEYDIENLKKCYFLVCDSETYEAQKKYFDAFPTIFNDFNTAFDYNERIANENLYEESLDYITKFFHLYKNINPHELSNKIISICINGRWDADAVTYLQINVINIVTSSHLSKNNCYDSSDIFPCFNDTLRDALLSRLALLSDDEVLSFWKFYLDRPETMPVDEKLYQQTKTIIQEYPNLLRQLQNAYIHALLNIPNENDIE